MNAKTFNIKTLFSGITFIIQLQPFSSELWYTSFTSHIQIKINNIINHSLKACWLQVYCLECVKMNLMNVSLHTTKYSAIHLFSRVTFFLQYDNKQVVYSNTNSYISTHFICKIHRIFEFCGNNFSNVKIEFRLHGKLNHFLELNKDFFHSNVDFLPVLKIYLFDVTTDWHNYTESMELSNTQ